MRFFSGLLLLSSERERSGSLTSVQSVTARATKLVSTIAEGYSAGEFVVLKLAEQSNRNVAIQVAQHALD